MHCHHLQVVHILTIPDVSFRHGRIIIITFLTKSRIPVTIMLALQKARMDLLRIMQPCQTNEVHHCRVYCTIHYTIHMLWTYWIYVIVHEGNTRMNSRNQYNKKNKTEILVLMIIVQQVNTRCTRYAYSQRYYKALRLFSLPQQRQIVNKLSVMLIKIMEICLHW